MKITIISFLILAMIMPQFKCIGSEYLFTKLDGALSNNSQNLYRLHQVFYPPGRIQTGTVYVRIRRCDFTVRNITNTTINYYASPAFTKCTSIKYYDCVTQMLYCARIRDKDNNDYYSIEFSLSDNEVLDSHSRLSNFITEYADFFQYIDYISFELFNYMTFLKLNSNNFYESQVHYGDTSNNIEISLSIDELHEMPSEYEVIKELTYVLEWVSAFQQ